jgi:hypothetical protein
MAAPLCHFCLSDPMEEKFRIHVPAGDKQLVVYQCKQCQRIEAVTE